MISSCELKSFLPTKALKMEFLICSNVVISSEMMPESVSSFEIVFEENKGQQCPQTVGIYRVIRD